MAELPPAEAHIDSPQNPFAALGEQFYVERSGSQTIHREVDRTQDGQLVAQTRAVITYAIGSGTHAYSYLIDRDGILTQSPITWFAQKQSWDLSPGFEHTSDRFERPVASGCLFCHCNHAEAVPDTMNAYREPIFQGFAIGCERCHGPGARHVRAREEGEAPSEPDATIVNPARLDAALREAVCEQCHLGGDARVRRRGRDAFDYRPGLLLEQFWRVFVLPEAATAKNRVAGHVQQLRSSQCFLRSQGSLGCISCHDPHSLPSAQMSVAYYRERCLHCHQVLADGQVVRRIGTRDVMTGRKEGLDQGTHAATNSPLPSRSLHSPAPERSGFSVHASVTHHSPTDDCIGCHMPRAATNISHVALTDHRIPRRPDPSGTEQPHSLPTTLLLPFHHDKLDLDDPEISRDAAVALIERARVKPGVSRLKASQLSIPLLEKAVQLNSDDLAARENLGVALAWQGELERALEVFDQALEIAPRREMILVDAGVAAQRLGDADRSLNYWERALALNSWSSRYRFEVANILAQRGDWQKAVAECKRLLAQNGSHANGHLLMMQYHLKNGARMQAQAELRTALALHPPNEADLRKTFADLLR
jgi:hypothetical protein